MKLVFGLIGVYLGGLLGEWEGAIFGCLIGILFGGYIELKRRVNTLGESLNTIRTNLIESNTQAGKSRSDTTGVDSEAPTVIPGISKNKSQAGSQQGPWGKTQSPVADTLTGVAEERETIREQSSTPGFIDYVINYIKEFFTTGNVVAKIGIIVLFFGVAFLINYAVERNAFPLELRLALIALGGIIMLFTGWRLRHRKPAYALVLQGGAVGVLYFTVYATGKLYALMPLEYAFFIMFALVVLSGVLAYIQDSRVLAIFGTTGGFLAPVLTSSEQGSHIILFSYYALLNTGVFGLAWFKAWRSLNWVGFVFTFVIASLWGYRYYQPAYFDSTEPFLILFFLFYVTIAILFAQRQPPNLKGLVDGSLVFGVPLIGFTLQSELVSDFKYGQAWSALAMSVIYFLLTMMLWQKQTLRILAEAFLALGVIFGSLAVPFTLDGHWTATVWALEGAGICWIGIRQHRVLPRLFGLLLQFGGAIAFLSAIEEPPGEMAVLNSAYIGSVFVAIAGLFTSYYQYRHKDQLKSWEQGFHVVLLIWGLLWWMGAGIAEIDEYLPGRFVTNASISFIAISALVLSLIASRLKWRAAEYPAVLLMPVMALIAFTLFVDTAGKNPFLNLGYAAWGLAFAIQYYLLWHAEKTWQQQLLKFWHAGTLWLFIFMATWGIARFTGNIAPNAPVWEDIAWGFVPTVWIFILLAVKQKIKWPVQRFQRSYLSEGLTPIIAYLGMWTIVVSFFEGDPKPLRYIPVLNPLDIAQLFSINIIYEWLRQLKTGEIQKIPVCNTDQLMYVLAGVAFVWLNALVAHCVHFYGNVNYELEALWRSALFQTSISIVWTLTALSIMGAATWKELRKPWFVGAALLGAVVIKLFVVDVKDTGNITQIISFLTVGILILTIAYLSPLPPRVVQEKQE